MINYILSTDAGNEPITIQQAQDQLRVDSDDDQELLDQMIGAARSMFETDTDYILTNQTWVQHRDSFPTDDTICIKKYPIRGITSIEYYDEDGALQTFSNTNYNINLSGRETIIQLNDGIDWPDVEVGRADAVQVTFTAGYTDSVSSTPKDVKQAMLMLISHFYDNRMAAAASPGITAVTMPLGYERLITRHRYFG